jgi:predicted dehydrogenase
VPRSWRFGIIGCGGVVEELHLPAWRMLPDVELVALCDSSTARLDAVGARYPAARRYLEVEEFLSSASDLDFVVLATPARSHPALAGRAIRQGLHLLCEKPLAFSAGDASALFDLAERNGVMLTCIHNYRFKDNSQQALQAQARGQLGDIVAVNVCFRSGPLFEERPPWRRRERENRILLFDIGIHFVDLALLFLGPVETLRFVDASVDQVGIQRVVFTTAHRSGCRGLFEMMVDASNCRTEIEILGESRSMALQFFPNGFRMLPPRETPLHRAIADARRLLAYGRQALPGWIGAPNSSRANSHAELFRRFVGALGGSADNPVPRGGVIETIALLDNVARLAYGETAIAPPAPG